MNTQSLVAKVWNFAHVLRDQGVSYQVYISQISYLLFLKMDEERASRRSAKPRCCRRARAKNEISLGDSTRFGSSSPALKNISLPEYPKSVASFVPFRSPEGRIAIVTNAERDCGGREALSAIVCADEQCPCGRQSRVVLAPRRWR